MLFPFIPPMPIHTVTTHPKPSYKIPGWHYSYFDQPTNAGGQSVAVFSPAISDIIKPGFQFDESQLRFEPTLGASVLELDFHEPQQMEEPSIPPDPEAGWGDPDYLPTTELGHGSNGHRPPHPHTARKRAREEGAQVLPAALVRIASEIASCYCMIYRLISPVVNEARRADVAQKLTAIACIPYYRAAGVELSEDDVKGMTM